MTISVLDPTAEEESENRVLIKRLTSISGATIGLLDISKPRGDIFLDTVQSLLENVGAKVLRFTKPTFSKPAPVDLRHEIATTCDAVIEALAD
jgi:alpha-galactosidase/6-phospho-beta-glucosidase family protein